jgi:DNA-binding CsgD family transcriptional regulator
LIPKGSAAGRPRWLVVSDCWSGAGSLLFWGTIVDLDSEKAAALLSAGRIVPCTPAVYREFAEQVHQLLTKREREVIELAGLPDKQIAVHLGIARGTLRTHLQRIYIKLHRPGKAAAGMFWTAWQIRYW